MAWNSLGTQHTAVPHHWDVPAKDVPALLDDLCSVCVCFNHIMVHAKEENPCQTLWGLEGNQRRNHHTLAWHKASVPSVRDDGDLRANTVNDKQCRTCWASQGQ